MKWPRTGTWVDVKCKDRVPGKTATHSGVLFQIDEKVKFIIIMNPVVPENYETLPLPLRPSVHHSVRIIPMDTILNVSPKKNDPPNQLSIPAVRPVKVERLLRREQRAVKTRQALFGSRAPTGTSSEALSIFTALSKTYSYLVHVS